MTYDGGPAPSLSEKIQIMGIEIDRLRGLLAKIERESTFSVQVLGEVSPLFANTFERIRVLAKSASSSVQS